MSGYNLICVLFESCDFVGMCLDIFFIFKLIKQIKKNKKYIQTFLFPNTAFGMQE